MISIILTSLLLPISISAATDSSGLTVTNMGIILIVSPGQVLTQKITVSNGSDDPSTDISVNVDGIAQSASGTYILLTPDQDTNPNTARTFIALNQTSIHLNPGQSQDITVTITVPQNVGNAGYFAIINISTSPSATSESGVAIVTSINVPVYLTIKDSQLTQTGKITGITTGDITNGKPITINTTFQNTGNTYFKVEGAVEVTTDNGFILEDFPIPLTDSSVIPGMSRDLESIYTSGSGLPVGTYTINSKIMLQDGSVLDRSSGTFTIKEPYVPPAALGNVSLVPSGASTLQNTDGTISIYFPLGAAAIPVDISLNNIAASQLPVAPTGFTLTGSCFQVNGLTGLLAKDATVIVKYTTDDLSKAGGNAAKLRLMRWDQGTNQWVVLKTKVNSAAMTLSASSKQMGIFAVAVGVAASSPMNWLFVGGIIVAVILAAVFIILFIVMRKRERKPVKR